MVFNIGKDNAAALICANGPRSKQTKPHLNEKPTKLTTDEWGAEADVAREHQHMGNAIAAEGS
eukprot:575861-Pyramimonas_sp.AAC.1